MNRFFILALLLTSFVSCKESFVSKRDANIERFANVVSISKTPLNDKNPGGLFVDKGSWAGYTIPEINTPVAGFCGPFDINSQKWISKSLVALASNDSDVVLDTTIYYPGSAMIKGRVNGVGFEENLYFIDKNSAILKIDIDVADKLSLIGSKHQKESVSEVSDNKFIIKMPSSEIVSVVFPDYFELKNDGDSAYIATTSKKLKTHYIVLSYWNNNDEYESAILKNKKVDDMLYNAEQYIDKSNKRWSEYISKTLRNDMPEEYNRIAIKAVVTLISNWRSEKGDLFHEGIIPSHAVTYFNGFWAWDSWKHAAAISFIEPELAKNQIRTMFDYQQEDGMVIDCIFADKKYNNARDSKSSIVAWAVKEIFDNTADTAFVREMMPKMLKYYKWWYDKRDIDKNALCEFGSTDGTLVAAKWESGMDNAVRFDKSKLKKIADDAYVFDQQSVDLNTFLVFERNKLMELASIIGDTINLPDYSDVIRDYFFDSKKGYFYDRRDNGSFISMEACEGWLPLWTSLATASQAEAVKNMIIQPNKFSTYIPFPTCAADVQGFNPLGYWRGAVWLDQAYFGISGLRKYGYKKEADNYTDQIFTRCEGLIGDGPITENYNPMTGSRAQARHFSWSAAHLLMMYNEYGK